MVGEWAHTGQPGRRGDPISACFSLVPPDPSAQGTRGPMWVATRGWPFTKEGSHGL